MNPMTVPQEEPAWPTLAAALRTGADDYMLAAAVDILISLPGRLFARHDIVDRYLVILSTSDRGAPRCARIRWSDLGRAVAAGNVPLGDAEQRMLLIACSIAGGTPVSLSEAFVGLDVVNRAVLNVTLDRIVRRQR